MDPIERATIESALNGNDSAFEQVIQRYSRLLYAHAYSILRQPQEAEDVVQESLLKAHRTLWRVRHPEKMPQWLVSIVRNRALDVRKRHKTISFSGTEDEIEDSNISKPDDHAETLERRESIHNALAALPDHHRLAVTLRYLEGMDHQSIEKMMGLSNGSLRGLLGRALQTLRATLKPISSPS